MENPVAMVRLLGLRVLEDNKNKDSVEFSIPLLKDSEPFVRTRAHDLLTDLTGQNIPLDQPGEWEKWWQENRAAFVLDPQQMAQRREQRRRQLQEAIVRRNTADNVNPEP